MIRTMPQRNVSVSGFHYLFLTQSFSLQFSLRKMCSSISVKNFGNIESARKTSLRCGIRECIIRHLVQILCRCLFGFLCLGSLYFGSSELPVLLCGILSRILSQILAPMVGYVSTFCWIFILSIKYGPCSWIHPWSRLVLVVGLCLAWYVVHWYWLQWTVYNWLVAALLVCSF